MKGGHVLENSWFSSTFNLDSVVAHCASDRAHSSFERISAHPLVTFRRTQGLTSFKLEPNANVLDVQFGFGSGGVGRT